MSRCRPPEPEILLPRTGLSAQPLLNVSPEGTVTNVGANGVSRSLASCLPSRSESKCLHRSVFRSKKGDEWRGRVLWSVLPLTRRVLHPRDPGATDRKVPFNLSAGASGADLTLVTGTQTSPSKVPLVLSLVVPSVCCSDKLSPVRCLVMTLLTPFSPQFQPPSLLPFYRLRHRDAHPVLRKFFSMVKNVDFYISTVKSNSYFVYFRSTTVY